MSVNSKVRNILNSYRQGLLTLEETAYHLSKEAGYEDTYSAGEHDAVRAELQDMQCAKETGSK